MTPRTAEIESPQIPVPSNSFGLKFIIAERLAQLRTERVSCDDLFDLIVQHEVGSPPIKSISVASYLQCVNIAELI